MAFQGYEEAGSFRTDIPNSLMLIITEEEEKELLKAIRVDQKQKTFNINYSFKISE